MTHECRICERKRVVPVLLKSIERSPTAGNKYRLFCQGCEKWLPFCGEDDFRQSLNPHVLPVDGDAENGAEDIVALEDYDYGPEWEDLVEKAMGDRPVAEGTPMTDGGKSEDEEDSEEADVEVVNRFDCPGCGSTVEGYPDVCPECGAPYDW